MCVLNYRVIEIRVFALKTPNISIGTSRKLMKNTTV